MKKIKALNSEQERNIEPHQRSSLVTDNWHDRKNSSLVSTDRFINTTCIKDEERNNFKNMSFPNILVLILSAVVKKW